MMYGDKSSHSVSAYSKLRRLFYRHKVVIGAGLSLIAIVLISQSSIGEKWHHQTTRHYHSSSSLVRSLTQEGRYCINGTMCLSNEGKIYSISSDHKVTFKASIDEAIRNAMNVLQPCPETSPLLLGRKDYVLPKQTPRMSDIEMNNPLVSDGGHYKPPDCKAKWKVAIVIPYRNRQVHLLHLLDHLHPLLQRQQIDYKFYVINQYGNSTFNRAKLNNIGFMEMKKDYDYDCVVFQDVDLLLENDYVSYGCPDLPRHLAVAISTHDYQLTYAQYTGGVTQFTVKHFEKVNGFSNIFWGWGGEDDDIFYRVHVSGLKFIRYPIEISRYYMFKHDRDKGNEVNNARYDQLAQGLNNSKHEGLNTLNYKVINRQKNPLYYNITVDVLAPAKSMIIPLNETKLKGSSKEMREIRKVASFNDVVIPPKPKDTPQKKDESSNAT